MESGDDWKCSEWSEGGGTGMMDMGRMGDEGAEEVEEEVEGGGIESTPSATYILYTYNRTEDETGNDMLCTAEGAK